jgi:hypothetical protein
LNFYSAVSFLAPSSKLRAEGRGHFGYWVVVICDNVMV